MSAPPTTGSDEHAPTTADIVVSGPDRDEIVALTIRYCWALDQLRFDDLSHVFAPDAVSDYGSDARYVGPEQLGTFFAAVVKAGNIDRSQHLVANHQVTVDGNVATCRSQYQSHYVLHPDPGSDQPRVLDTGGSYLDHLRRTEHGWRITHRVAVRTWMIGEEAPGALTLGHDTAFVVAGWIDLEPGSRDRLMTAAETVTAATAESEEGCLDYSLVADPTAADRIRVFTRWRSEGDFRGHMDRAHTAAFHQALTSAGITARSLRRYVVREETPVRAFVVPALPA